MATQKLSPHTEQPPTGMSGQGVGPAGTVAEVGVGTSAGMGAGIGAGTGGVSGVTAKSPGMHSHKPTTEIRKGH